MTATQAQLERDLNQLGVQQGGLLFVHSSFKSLGPVAGGVAALIAALEAALGPDGLLAMPSFNLVERDRRASTWDLNSTPSTVGWITEYFRRMPGTWRSDHYSHSMAARGHQADQLVKEHRRLEGPKSPWDLQPWGRTYGFYSPMHKAYKRNGQLLMLGVDYISSTYVHLVETLYWNKQLELDPDAAYVALDRAALGAFWDQSEHLNRGLVGRAPCRLFRIGDYVDALLAAVERHPQTYRSRPKTAS